MNRPENERIIQAANNWVSEDDRHAMGAAIHPARSVIFAKVGAAIFLERKRILSMAACLDNNMMSIAPNPRLVDSSFLQYALAYRSLGELVSTTALPALSSGVLRRQPMLIPISLTEQRRIAELLEEMDEALDAQSHLLDKMRGVRAATMHELLSGSSRFTGATDPWTSEPFAESFRVISIRGHQVQTSEYQALGAVPIVDQGKSAIAGYSDRLDLRIGCPTGGAIVFGDHTCVVKYVNHDFIAGADGTKVLAAGPGWNTRFLAYLMEFRGVPATGYNRHFRFLKAMSFRKPPLDTQIAISRILMDIDENIATLERELTKARDVNTAAAQELLAARTRLV